MQHILIIDDDEQVRELCRTVLEDAGLQTVAGWATNLNRGPANESTQTLSFTVTNDNNALFTKGGQPAISSTGVLTYTPAPNAYGKANVTVTLMDNGGTANGGVNRSATSTFTIEVLKASGELFTSMTVTLAWNDNSDADSPGRSRIRSSR